MQQYAANCEGRMKGLNTFTVSSSDKSTLREAFALEPAGAEARGVVQILHGMAEHKNRYLEFASFLASAGYVVVAHDHRGHGVSEPEETRTGFFAPQAGWNAVVDDVFQVRAWITGAYPQLPVYLFGHSMGSFVARSCMLREASAYAGYIFCGTASHPGVSGYVGRFLARVLSAGRGGRTRSPFLSSMASAGFNRQFLPTRTEYDWLSRDEAEVDAYIEDPACGFVPCRAFFRDMAGGLIEINTPSRLRAVQDPVPVLLISGGSDPVGDSGAGVEKVARLLREHTPCEVTVRIFPGDRHELVKELDRTEVFRTVTAWLGSQGHWGNRPTRTSQ